MQTKQVLPLIGGGSDALFLEYMAARGLDSKTLMSYQGSLSRLDRFLGEEKSSCAQETTPTTRGAGVPAARDLATQKDISNFKKWLVDTFKPGTVRLTLVHINAYYNWLVEQSMVVDNPLENVNRPPVSPTIIKWLSKSEQNALLREARRVPCGIGKTPTDAQAKAQLREYCIILCFLRLGLRVNELCDLTLGNLTLGDRKGAVYIQGKGDKDRVVPINGELLKVLKDYLASRKDHPSSYVFPSQRSAQSSTRAIQFMVDDYRDRLNISHLTCHALRHTFGHDLAQNHVPLDVIARLMGHFKADGTPNIAMTMRYTTPGMEDLERAVESISWD